MQYTPVLIQYTLSSVHSPCALSAIPGLPSICHLITNFYILIPPSRCTYGPIPCSICVSLDQSCQSFSWDRLPVNVPLPPYRETRRRSPWNGHRAQKTSTWLTHKRTVLLCQSHCPSMHFRILLWGLMINVVHKTSSDSSFEDSRRKSG